ncbi:hypothetical protein [Streptomyces sp. NPDC006971]|uniref:hypothetical protein n=1 Tax=Streptomyces sp. NPDC006971 TaxID=3154784 RepID=UPI0033C0665F
MSPGAATERLTEEGRTLEGAAQARQLFDTHMPELVPVLDRACRTVRRGKRCRERHWRERVHSPDRTADGRRKRLARRTPPEQDALGRIILKLEQTRLADGPPQAVRGAGVDARTDAINRSQDGS